MKSEYNLIRLSLETWCSLSVQQCAASHIENLTLAACVVMDFHLNPFKLNMTPLDFRQRREWLIKLISHRKGRTFHIISYNRYKIWSLFLF